MSNDFLEAYWRREKQIEEEMERQDRLIELGKNEEKNNIARRLIDNGLEVEKASDYTGIDVSDIPPSVIETKPDFHDYSNLTREYIDEVWDMLENPNLEPDVKRQYELKQRYIRDTLSNISGAWNDGKEQAKVEVAKRLLEINMEEEEILMGTALKKDELLRLREKKIRDDLSNLSGAKEKGKKEGMEIGERMKALEVAKRLIKKGMEKEEVSDVTGLPLSDLQNL